MSAVSHLQEYKTGRFYTDEFRGDSSWNGYEWNNLLRNDGPGPDGVPRFTDVGMAMGADDDRDARGIAIADYDNDGDLDVVVNHNPGDTGDPERARVRYLENRIGDRRPWLAVEVIGADGNRDALGARITIEAGGRRQLRQVNAGSSYASQHSRRLYFGLGEQTTVDSLEIDWPNGTSERFEALPGRALVRITQGRGLELLSLRGEPLGDPAEGTAD